MPPKNGAASPDVSPTAGADLPSVSVLIVRVATASGTKVEYIKPRSAWYKRTLALRAARATVRMIAGAGLGNQHGSRVGLLSRQFWLAPLMASINTCEHVDENMALGRIMQRVCAHVATTCAIPCRPLYNTRSRRPPAEASVREVTVVA